ncbi:hypothetical protein ACMA5I_06615 [Paracoccaceae bacterium GXU_MW_L88]
MRCPKCNGRGMAYGTKAHGETTQRYRRCRICGHKFSTWEEREDREIREYRRKDNTPPLFEDKDE